MGGILDKLHGFVEKVGKHNFILIMFIVVVLIISGLYQTFSLYTQSEGVSLIDGIKTLRFVLGSDQGNSVVIASGSSKNIAITVSNEEDVKLQYGVYYSSDDDLSSVNLGYVLSSDYPAVGLIDEDSDYIVTIKIENRSNDAVIINFGLVYGVEKGGDLVLEEYQTLVGTFPVALSEVEVGSYVSYVGSGGMVGEEKVVCQVNGIASSEIPEDETESPNSCLGQNAREDLGLGETGYGYCYNSEFMYSTTGWRVAYIDDSIVGEEKAVIVSAGSPECNSRAVVDGNENYIQMANAKALKYCNTEFVDGDCECLDSDLDGLCDVASSDAWAISDIDFYRMTKAFSGVGKRLAINSSTFGDLGGNLGNRLYCFEDGNISTSDDCGSSNSLIHNGGFYWFASQVDLQSVYGLYWDPKETLVNGYANSDSYGLRPMISLSSSVYVTGGTGTMDDPYTILKK